MKRGSIYATTVGKALEWARANALWFVTTGSTCCADEVLCSQAARYDVERFGAFPQVDPGQADLLIVNGAVSYKSAGYLREVYDSMLSPRYVMAVGACASCGGLFAPEFSYSVVAGADRIVPVDVYVPGCPPRPEAFMQGLLSLQERIRGNRGTDRSAW